MRTRFAVRLTATSLMLLFVASVSISQAVPPKPLTEPPAPGNIQLPIGYANERRRGIDSRRGAIVRVADGFTINYDIGRMAGLYAYQYFPTYFDAQRKQTHLNEKTIESNIQQLDRAVNWRKEEDVNGEKMMIVLLNSGKIIASFPDSYANFFADTDATEKIDDFLKIVRTYRSLSR